MAKRTGCGKTDGLGALEKSKPLRDGARVTVPLPSVDPISNMRTRHSGVRSSSVVALGLMIELGSQFARTMLLARALGAAEFGLVTSINTLVALVEMFSFLGVDRYLVYSQEGDAPHELAIAHGLSWSRGLLGAALILSLAWPTAVALGVRDQTHAFMIVAIAPLLRGAAHLGVVQMQRVGRFWPSTLTDAGGALLGFAAAAAAVMVARDHRAILWALTAQAAGILILSHLLARAGPYRLSFDRNRNREALRYGLPLLVNGLALGVAFQLDRIIVGSWLGVTALGAYGLSVTLLFQPVTLLGRLATTTLQPRISAAWHNDRSEAFPRFVSQLAGWAALLSAAGAMGTVCLGAPVLRFLFGPSFSLSDAFFVLMGFVLLVRINRHVVNLLGLAIGRTTDLMISNIVGASALPAMIAAFLVYLGPASASFGALFGDLSAFAVADARLRRASSSAGKAIGRGMAVAAILPALFGVWILLVNPPLWVRTAGLAAGLGALSLVLLVRRAAGSTVNICHFLTRASNRSESNPDSISQ